MNNLNRFSLAGASRWLASRGKPLVASHRLTPTKIVLESSKSGPIYD